MGVDTSVVELTAFVAPTHDARIRYRYLAIWSAWHYVIQGIRQELVDGTYKVPGHTWLII